MLEHRAFLIAFHTRTVHLIFTKQDMEKRNREKCEWSVLNDSDWSTVAKHQTLRTAFPPSSQIFLKMVRPFFGSARNGTVNQRERFDPMVEKQVEVSLHEVTGDAQPWHVRLPAAVVIIKANGDLTPLGDGPQRVNV